MDCRRSALPAHGLCPANCRRTSLQPKAVTDGTRPSAVAQASRMGGDTCCGVAVEATATSFARLRRAAPNPRSVSRCRSCSTIARRSVDARGSLVEQPLRGLGPGHFDGRQHGDDPDPEPPHRRAERPVIRSCCHAAELTASGNSCTKHTIISFICGQIFFG